MSEQLHLDLDGSRAGRDDGIARVMASNPDWFERAMAFVMSLPPGWIGISETIRFLAQDTDVGLPKHQNAWGSLAHHAKVRGYLAPTGRWLPMKDVSSHARRTPEYRRTTYRSEEDDEAFAQMEMTQFARETLR